MAWKLNCFLAFICFFALNCLVDARNVNREQLRMIKLKINSSVDPCDDFHQYACGKWDSVHPKTDYYETIGYIDFKVNKEFVKIFKTFEKDVTGKPQFELKAYDFYKSCSKLPAFNPLEFLQIIENDEGFPVYSLFSEGEPIQHVDWVALLATLRRYEMNSIFVEELVVQNPKDSQSSVIDIDMPVVNDGLKPMKYKEYHLVMRYLKLDTIPEWDDFWPDFKLFESNIKQLETRADDHSEESFNEKTNTFPGLKPLKDIQPPYIKRYVEHLLGKNADPNLNVFIHHETYLNELFSFVEGFQPVFVARYLVIRFVWYLHASAPPNFFKVDCVSHTRSLLPLPMQYMYERYLPQVPESFPDVENIFKNLIQEFNRTIEHNRNKFDSQIMSFLISKLNAKKIKVGNIPRRNTVQIIEDYHATLDIDKDNYYTSYLNLLKFTFKMNHDTILTRSIYNKDDFFHIQDRETAANSSPYYLGRFNIVIVPATLLQSPIYESNFYDLFKLSSLGFLLAHEIVHGFDLSGIMFDQYGNLRGPASSIYQNRFFDSSLGCLQKRNSRIIDEKIADVSGLRLAYAVYFDGSYQKDSNSRSFTSVEYSNKELFFLNFAQFFCGTVSTDYSESLMEHGSDRQRLIDALANFKKFAEIYHCPPESRMNPSNKCHLWR